MFLFFNTNLLAEYRLEPVNCTIKKKDNCGAYLYNSKTGSNLKRPQPGGGARKRSFCARMSGVKGPMKDSKGRPTRKALALRRWKC